MKTNKYEHYFDIDEEFFSAVNQELINEGKVDWRKFFPHETFVKLLKDTYSVLTRQHLSIWVEGGYGTGKSYAVLRNCKSKTVWTNAMQYYCFYSRIRFKRVYF